MWKIAAIKDSKVYVGQTSNFLWDYPSLSSQVHEKFDVLLISLVRLNKFGSSNTFHPSVSEGLDVGRSSPGQTLSIFTCHELTLV